MTPNGQLTELRVWKMIQEALEKYDLGNTNRHKENSSKMDATNKKIDRLLWAALGTFAAAAGALLMQVIHLSTGH
jgi:hypothetical protein